MSFLRHDDSCDSCFTPAVSKRRRPVVLSVDIGSPTYSSCIKFSKQDGSSRLNTANMSFNSELLDRSNASAASSMRAQGVFSARSLHLQSLHCSPLSHTHCGVLRAVETPAGSMSCSAAAVLAQTVGAADVSQLVVQDWFQDAIASCSTVFHVEVDIVHCSPQVIASPPLLSTPANHQPPPHAVAASHLLQVLQCAASLGILRQVGDNSVTLCMRGPAVDVGFSSEWALLLRSSSVANPSPIEYIKTPITPFGTA